MCNECHVSPSGHTPELMCAVSTSETTPSVWSLRRFLADSRTQQRVRRGEGGNTEWSCRKEGGKKGDWKKKKNWTGFPTERHKARSSWWQLAGIQTQETPRDSPCERWGWTSLETLEPECQDSSQHVNRRGNGRLTDERVGGGDGAEWGAKHTAGKKWSRLI